MSNEKNVINEEVEAKDEVQEDIEPEANESQPVEEQEEGIEEQEAEESEVEELKRKLEEQENRYLRLQADFDNSRRRAKLDLEAERKYRAQSLAEDILPALDNFDRALSVETDDEQTQSILKGMTMVYNQLVEALKKEGVEAIEAVGQPFDPYQHQAIMQVSDDSFDSNVVVEELQKGYKLKDRIIRPAMVKVNE
jgi:molecular chaperone GrpE